MTDNPAGRTLDIDLHLLDRQVVDRDGNLVCKVDDLEFERGADGALYVTAILVGPRALGQRIPGRLGTWLRTTAERLSRRDPPRVDMSLVSEIGSEIKISVSRDDVDVDDLEDWLREHFIARIPGNSHASE